MNNFKGLTDYCRGYFLHANNQVNGGYVATYVGQSHSACPGILARYGSIIYCECECHADVFVKEFNLVTDIQGTIFG